MIDRKLLARVANHEHYSRKCNTGTVRAVYRAVLEHSQARLREPKAMGRDLQPGVVSLAYGLPMGLSASVERRPDPPRTQRTELASGVGPVEEVARVWQHSLVSIRADLDLRSMTGDGRHAVAKKGGPSVAYQARKRAKTSHSLPSTDRHGSIVASTGIVAGNPNDAFNLKGHLQAAFKAIKRLGWVIAGPFFNADSAFDTQEARKVCFNHQLIPTMAENKRHRKHAKRGRKRCFDATVYKIRVVSTRTFAWIDKCRALRVRFDLKDVNFLAGHHLAFALINLRHLFARKV